MKNKVATSRRIRREQAARARRARTAAPISPAPNLKRPAVRGRIAEAVHRAVCEFSGTGGLGLCMLYAVAGAGLLGRVFGKRVYPQAGTLAVLAEPPDLWMMMDASNFDAGEFHCWLGGPSSHGQGAELIDFAARHYRRYCEDLINMGEFEVAGPGLYVRREEALEEHMRPAWRRENPPDYVWSDGLLPEWLKFIPTQEATEAVWAKMLRHLDEHQSLVQLAVQVFHDLSRGRDDSLGVRTGGGA